jgi:hypothetical protein
MKFEKLLARAKRIALKLAQREIACILAKTDRPADVKVSASEDGVALEGRNLKARVVTDPSVRNIARGGSK